MQFKTPNLEILYCVLADDSIEKGYFSKFLKKTHYMSLGCSKLKIAHPVNYFPGFLGKNIKSSYLPPCI